MKEYKTPVIEEVKEDDAIADIFESWGYCKAYVDRALAELSRYRITGMTPGEIAEMRRQNSAETHDGWIPVEERLPEEFLPVLVTACVPVRKPGWDKRKEFFVVVDTDVYDTEIKHGWEHFKDKVTAWMPLPEPYSPERRNDEKE